MAQLLLQDSKLRDVRKSHVTSFLTIPDVLSYRKSHKKAFQQTQKSVSLVFQREYRRFLDLYHDSPRLRNVKTLHPHLDTFLDRSVTILQLFNLQWKKKSSLQQWNILLVLEDLLTLFLTYRLSSRILSVIQKSQTDLRNRHLPTYYSRIHDTYHL